MSGFKKHFLTNSKQRKQMNVFFLGIEEILKSEPCDVHNRRSAHYLKLGDQAISTNFQGYRQILKHIQGAVSLKLDLNVISI